MVQKHIDRLEQEIKDNLEMIELLEPKRAEKIKNGSEYQEYIKSQEWQEVRQKIFKRDNFRCVKCGASKNLQVHHITYENLGEEKYADLVTLCNDCHNATHNMTTIDYLALACANAYNIRDNSSDEKAKEKAKRDIAIISKAAEELADKNTVLIQAIDAMYMFAYAVRMGERYDKLDSDLKLSEGDFPPEMINIIGNDFDSVINKCLIGAGDKKINEDFAEAKYLELFIKIRNRRTELLSDAFSIASGKAKEELGNTALNNIKTVKKAKDLLGEL